MQDSLDTFLLPVRQHLLRNLLRYFAVAAGLACSIAIIEQFLLGGYELILFYLLFYFSFVYLALKQNMRFEIRRILPALLLVTLLVFEYSLFGTTAFSHYIVYALVVFTGLMYGVRTALVTLAIVFAVISYRFWDAYFSSLTGPVPVSDHLGAFVAWITPTIGQIALIAITVAAISIMFRQVLVSVAEKHELIGELQREIEHKERAEDALKLSEEQFARLFQHSNDAVIFIETASGKILLANKAAETLTGRAQADIRRLPISALLQDGAIAILEQLQNRAISAPPRRVTLAQDNGEVRIAEVTITDVDGRLAFLLFRDVTEKKKLEEQVAQTHKMEAIGQLAGGIAHDFNNSLQVIIGFCELARYKIAGGEGAAELEKIYDSGKRAQKLVGQLLAFSRRQHLESKPVNLNTAVEESLSLVKRLLGSHIELIFQPSTAALVVAGDLTQIEQVLLNLCINARDAIGENGTMKISLDQADFDTQFCAQNPWARPGRYARLTVEDNGCGMSKNVVQKVFEPFFTTKEAGKGTGLGLSSVLGIVQQHEGFLHLASEVDQGTRVFVYLPLTEPPQPQQASETLSAQQPGKATILLTDSNGPVRTVTRELLKHGGYDVIEAGDAEEAIKQFSEHSAAINLVIMDIVMPHMQGTQASIRLREIKPDIQVLFITGYNQDNIIGSTELDGRAEFIQKPFQQAELLQKVRQMLNA